jgi:hypothetical protein
MQLNHGTENDSLVADRGETLKCLAAQYTIHDAKTKAMDDTEQAGKNGAIISAKYSSDINI